MKASSWNDMIKSGWSEGQCRMLGLIPPEEVGEIAEGENLGSGMRVVLPGSSTASGRASRGSYARSFAPGKGEQA